MAIPTLPTLPTLATLAALPEPAKAKTSQGADTFVRYFFAQLNVAYGSSNASIIKALQNGESVPATTTKVRSRLPVKPATFSEGTRSRSEMSQLRRFNHSERQLTSLEPFRLDRRSMLGVPC